MVEENVQSMEEGNIVAEELSEAFGTQEGYYIILAKRFRWTQEFLEV